ncbi:MAG: glycosyltransferase family 39 protein [Candidatus Zambryskibacteria bacterium]|nr:glycosyltransferase family 39 protein [Candidatus Zambryskibacteria bacterium]
MTKDKIIISGLLILLAVFSICLLQPQIAGDSFHYTDSIEVLKTGIVPEEFMPMMIVSTYLGLQSIMFFDLFTNSFKVSWLLLNGIFYVFMGLSAYLLIKEMFGDKLTAFLGALFLVVNYAVVVFGLAYMMDMGGWFFYMVSLYFSYKYFKNDNESDKWLYLSSVLVGLGGLYKEYAFVAYVVIFGIIIFRDWTDWLKILKKVIITGCISFGPFLLLNIYGFLKFDYTYLDWFLEQKKYSFQNKTLEFIKSFGSIFNFGWLLFFPGFYLLLNRTKNMIKSKIINRDLIFIWLVIFSCISVLLWPVVTRVLFITMPAAILVSSLFIKKLSRNLRLCITLPILALYMISSYFMDSFILDFVNLPLGFLE